MIDMVALTEAVVSDAQILGVFDRVNSYEPKNAPGTGITASIWADDIALIPGDSGLAAVSVRVSFMIRVYIATQRQPYEAIESDILDATSKLLNSYAGDFQLGGLIEHVDLLGRTGAPMSAKAGYVETDGKVYRVVTIVLPCIISDAYSEVP